MMRHVLSPRSSSRILKIISEISGKLQKLFEDNFSKILRPTVGGFRIMKNGSGVSSTDSWAAAADVVYECSNAVIIGYEA